MKIVFLAAWVFGFAFLLQGAEPHRPSYHFTPAKNWMNDPNGMVYHEGEWHLFYQYNPHGTKWGHMSWGHAVSRDLLNWEHLPLALAEENGIMIFSGSAVVDHGNTSGFGKDGKDPLVAIYTAHTSKIQSQALAFSNDRGRTWTKYDGNPVLDIGEKDFRDPKVFWHEPTKRWIMTISWSQQRKVRFYSSPDLKTWTHLSDFGPAGSVTGIYECPDLIKLKVEGGGEKWVLIVNVGGGAPAGGSGGQYFVGDFDGTKFTAHEPSVPKGSPASEPGGRILSDFENGYGDWKVSGDCFGSGPANGGLAGQQAVSGFKGNALVNTFLKGDATTGIMTSPEFQIDERWLSFLIGGGAHVGKTCVNLKVDGKLVYTATGKESERLDWVSWDVAKYRGKSGMIEIVDTATGGWGHINADQFVLGSSPAKPAKEGGVWMDYGPDFYAGVTWSGGPEGDDRCVLLAWMSNWQYANRVPTSPWRSAMSIPREISLAKVGEAYRLVQKPVRELESITTSTKTFSGGSTVGANQWLMEEKIAGDKLDLELSIVPDDSGVISFDVLANKDFETRILVDSRKGSLRVDRTKSGLVDFHPHFARPATGPLLKEYGGAIPLRILIDACSVEVFTADGLTSLTSLVLPPADARAVRIGRAGSVEKISVKTLGGN